MRSALGEFKDGWGVVLASAAGFGLGLSGLPFYTSGVFAEPLGHAFGWSAAQVQGGLTLMLLTNLVTLPAAAWMSRRIGPRPVALISVASFSAAIMSLALLRGGLPEFYLHWVIVSAAGAGTLGVVWSEVLSRRFQRARGAALGLAMMGTGITGFVAPVLAQALIHAVGWRGAYAALGALPLLAAWPLVWLFFRETGQAAPEPVVEASGDFWTIARDRRFWTIGLAFLLVGCAVAGVLPNLMRLIRTHGLPSGAAAAAVSFAGLFVVLGRAACGPMLDRVWAPAVAAGFFMLAAGGCVLMVQKGVSPIMLTAGAAAVGLAAGAELDVLPYLAGRYFGVDWLGLTFALLSSFFYFGSALGPWGVAAAAEALGGYERPLLGAALLLSAGGGLLLTLGLYPVQGTDPSASDPMAAP